MYVSLKPMGGTSKLLMMLSSPFPLLYPRPSAFRLLLNSRATFSSIPKRTFSYTCPPRLVGFSINSNSSSQHIQTSVARDDFHADPSPHSPLSSRVSHCWPEWSNLVDNLRLSGYFDRQLPELDGEDALSVFENISEDFVRAASACLSFAREHHHLLGSLSRRDIEIIVENGFPLLFKSSVDSARRMKSFLGTNQNNELVFERAHMVDLMRFLLSYVYNPVVSNQTNRSSGELVESSVRSLLKELAYESRIVQEPDLSASMPKQFPDGYGQASRPLRQNIEMKRGDWICPKCTFMNFARNMECLECNETRPKRQLTGGEWDCPQCNFFNYGKNVVCLRCDCRRPGEASGSAGPRFGFEYNNRNKADISNIRITSMEQRMGNVQYQGTLGNTSIPEQNNIQSIDGLDPGKSSVTSINQNLDRILGRASEGGKSDYVPFKPLPSGMFNKSEQVTNNNDFAADKPNELRNSSNSGDSLPLSRKPVIQTESKEDKEQAEKSERWFKKVAELHDVTDLASAISDEDFPEIMPMRKGENRFVVSKKKDRSLTSPLHKRRMAMEQTSNSTNFVPFVPFPPDYFAKKDKVPESEASTGKDISGTSAFSPPEIQAVAEKSGEQKATVLGSGVFKNSMLSAENQQSREESLDTSFSRKSFSESVGTYSYGMPSGNSTDAQPNTPSSRKEFSESGGNYYYGRPSGNSTEVRNDMRTDSRQSWTSGSWEGNGSSPMSPTGNSTQQSTSAHNATESWKGGFLGKSLEGSLVKEPDPLDMSEEAKTERWFRRAAQIKDISELSQIPDEDFPQIMPMRKGVNRFVVSKRKTPLERRLTSPQYRRNLPIVSSEPVKKENNES